MNYVDKPRTTTIIGHRGARGIYPENTMAGFRYLRDIGVNAVEIDVQNAAGHVPILAHDLHLVPALTRDYDGAWINDERILMLHMTVEELAKLDVGTICPGTEYAALFPDQARLSGQRIPLFANFCEWAATQSTLLVNVEIKSDAMRPEVFDPPEVIVDGVIDLLEKFGLTQRSIVSSFDWRVIHACAARAPNVTRGYLTLLHSHGTSMVPNIIDGSLWMDGANLSDHNNSLPETIANLGGQVWCPYFEELNHDELVHAQALGLRVNVWTVNDFDDIHRMADMGVDGIISDYPARVENILAKRAIA